MNTKFDVLVIGGGIAGLGAAWELNKKGLKVRVLESDPRVGGRMTTDKVDGYNIDRGATVFGSEFREMRRLVRETGLEEQIQTFKFNFDLLNGRRGLRVGRTRLLGVAASRLFGWRGKLAMAAFAVRVLLLGHKMEHGATGRATRLDNASIEEYLRGSGAGDFLDNLLLPALNGPLGGGLRQQSRLILFQVFWNILLRPTWALKGGLQQLPDALAANLDVVTGCHVQRVELGEPCRVHAEVGDETVTYEAAQVVFAVPGNLVPRLCPDLPRYLIDLLNATKYGAMTSAHVRLPRPPKTKSPAVGVADGNFEIELEHNRVEGLCPKGEGMASIYFWDDPAFPASKRTDAEVETRAREIIDECFPECAGEVDGVHVLRWRDGIAQFPKGRLTQMAALRRGMARWKLPVQLCGDYLDGISTEGALVTGVEAATNVSRALRPVAEAHLRTGDNPSDSRKAGSQRRPAVVHC